MAISSLGFLYIRVKAKIFFDRLLLTRRCSTNTLIENNATGWNRRRFRFRFNINAPLRGNITTCFCNLSTREASFTTSRNYVMSYISVTSYI